MAYLALRVGVGLALGEICVAEVVIGAVMQNAADAAWNRLAPMLEWNRLAPQNELCCAVLRQEREGWESGVWCCAAG